ncbi:sulfite exporter TauE/SafE family protein [Cryobacterium breve]|jgi:uncharacterized membrane protein YfcA|uniref:Probable membrane transporter protein n=1 Tax=Cryobacterium breve TaxID=1259258 RepID=A0ABY7NFZ4_9MICO|nr:sulfite exporter TauE/SafE family protein [Cryobacterium breve]WBM80525.1 sulfite exporter TauE/SafE family protein [Cryobacterium breve]
MWPEALVIVAAGFAAGMINVVVGSGTLITFPILVLLGYPPLVANVSNNLGLVAGGVSGTIAYRREIAAHRNFAFALLPVSLTGGLAGAGLLLVLPSSAFKAIVPVLILMGIVLVAIGPWIQRRVAAGAARSGRGPAPTVTTGTTAPATPGDPAGNRPASSGGWGALGGAGKRTAIVVCVFVLGLYGGYFGAAQGILMMGVLGALTSVSLGSLNAVKNLLVTAVNVMASIVFILFARDSIDWLVVAFITVGAGLGGILGARIGRRLPPTLLRVIIITVGIVALVNLLLRS